MATEIDRLILKLDADITRMEDKLNKAIRANYAAAKKIEESWKGKGFADAAKSGFESLADSAGEAAKSIPGLGAALGSLGPAGLAAAAGIGLVIEALNKAKEATEFGAEISKTADRLHITTDALQEYQFALRASGGDQTRVTEAIQTFSEMLGKAEAGMPRALRAFRELFGTGFTPQDVTNMGGVEKAITKIQGAIQGLNTEQKEGILSQFGLTGMKEMMEKPVADIQKFKDEAHDAGNVMDAGVLKSSREINEELETAFKKIDVDWKTALIELAPLLKIIVDKFAEITEKAAKFFDQFQELQKQQDETLEKRREFLVQRTTSADPLLDILPANKGPGSRREEMKRELQDVTDEQASRWWTPDKDKPPPATPPATRSLYDVTPPKKVSDETVAFDKTAFDAYQSSLKELTSAQQALATTLGQRATFEKQAVDQELTKKLGDLDAEEAKIRKAILDGKVDAHSKEQLAELEHAKTLATQAAVDKKILIDRQTYSAEVADEVRGFDERGQMQAELLKAQGDHLSATAALATTAKERNALERQALADQQAADRLLADNKIAMAEVLLEAAKRVSSDQANDPAVAEAQRTLDAARQARSILTGKQADDTAKQTVAQEGPVAAYERSIQDLNTTMAQAGVDAAKALSSGLADAIVNAKSLGDVASSVFKQLIQQILQAELEKNVTGPILALMGLPGHAAGTLSSASGLALVGENGPEFVNLPGGSQVIPNSALRDVGMGGQGIGGQTIVFDNRGAIIWEQAVRSMMSYADRSASVAGVGAVQTSRRGVPMELARSSARTLGR
jgi:hypothetical protein